MHNWIESHLEDGSKILKKPILFAEFGKCYKDLVFGLGERNNLLYMVYRHVNASTSRGGVGGGAMFWQLMEEGMSSYGDGYEIVLSQNPSTAALVSGQSHKLAELTHLFTKMYEYRRRQAHGHGHMKTIKS